MLVRLALESDFDTIVAMARDNIEATCPHIGFDEEIARATCYDYLRDADPTIFVAEHERKVVGFLLAGIYGYRASYGHRVACEVLYVDPAYRGSRAAARLLKHLVTWAKQIGAKEVVGGVENNFQPERTARLFEHFGFERVGYMLIRRN